MGLFTDMKKFGLSAYEDTAIYEAPAKEVATNDSTPTPPNLESFFYEKKVLCPICGRNFTTIMLRSGINPVIGKDTDLKPHYKYIDSARYDVFHCTCGYTALSKQFAKILPAQRQQIETHICANYKDRSFSKHPSLEESIDLYKLALLNTIIKRGKDSEKAYVCLKIAWFYRDLQQLDLEIEFLQHSVDGFAKALEKEVFPVLGLDEHTVIYITADLYRKLGNAQKALQYVSLLLYGKTVPERIKDKARDLKMAIGEGQPPS